MKEIGEVLVLILVANGTPVIASYLFSHRMSLPIDFGLRLNDQQYLFGLTKTWRGLFSSLIITSIVSDFMGYGIYYGLLIALLAMSGDLVSSFIKRRFKKASSAKVLLLDQLPESFFPALGMMQVISLSLIQVMVITAVFTIMELVLSYLLYQIGVRKRPY